MMYLESNCMRGSVQWNANVQKVKETNPDNFIFYKDIFGDNTLEDLLDGFNDKESVKREIIENLEHYAKFDLPSMYSILREKGYR